MPPAKLDLQALDALMLIAVFVGALVITGCTPIQPLENSRLQLKLPTAKMTADAVEMEVAVADISTNQLGDFETVYNESDCMQCPLDVRRRLDAEGFRVSVVSSASPTGLQELLKPTDVAPDRFDAFKQELASRGLLGKKSHLKLHRQIQKKDGEEYLIEISDIHAQATILLPSSPGTSEPVTVQNAQACFRMTTWPQSDGKVRLEFVPEIHHGASRSRFGIANRQFAFEDRRSIVRIDALQFEITVASGETVMIAATKRLTGLADLFFTPPVVISDAADLDADAMAKKLVDGSNVSDDQLLKYFPALKQVAARSAELPDDGAADPESESDRIAAFDELSDAIAKAQDVPPNVPATPVTATRPEPPAADPTQRFLLVRIRKTQMDDRFDTSLQLEKLSTTTLD